MMTILDTRTAAEAGLVGAGATAKVERAFDHKAPNNGARFVRFTLSSFGLTLRNVAYFVFTIAMPCLIYVIMSSAFGKETSKGGVTVAAIMMVQMAAYGGLGAAMNAGLRINAIRTSGWGRQLQLTGMWPSSIVLARIIEGGMIIFPSLVCVFLLGKFTQHVDLSFGTFTAIGALLWLGLLQMIVLGLTIGIWFRQDTSEVVNTLIMLVISILGGLWFPLSMFPSWMQSLGECLPTYWIGRIGQWPLVRISEAFPMKGIWVMAIWLSVLTVLCIVGYRRGVRQSTRRG